MFEFHISRRARDRYQLDESLFSFDGRVILGNLHAARELAHRLNEERDLVTYPEQAVQPGDVNAMGLLDELQHVLIRRYQEQVGPDVMGRALDALTAQVGADDVERVLREFVDQFPPVAVYRGDLTPEEYLAGETQGRSHREMAVEELMMLTIANMNPALEQFRELFDDSALRRNTAYSQIIVGLDQFFDSQATAFTGDRPLTPTAGASLSDLRSFNLLDLLRAPALASPYSAHDQLQYLQERFGALLGGFLLRLLTGIDLLKEEGRYFLAQQAGPGGPGPIEAPDFSLLADEPERFSLDTEWMPRLVLLAKNSYVWLDQLSREYDRPITRLDEIPDEELERLGRSGFSGLWLIGLWERSRASQTIKQLMGNTDAVASAYSLFDYDIAEDLGGDAAYQILRERAARHGVRLASDMVPNHMGIDSPWVVAHPDWFVRRDDVPYPSYTFTGPDLSWHDGVGIYLEDHYFDKTDAAVVFKRVEHGTGHTTYIYHGNDGTTMPWNDTAQLNYLHPDVREAVIQTILHVAQRFPVIRFDAAMTLAKRHYQRLWFPEPGTGGSIPSRSEYAMTKAQFDEAMPEEFWREVVDRVAREAPDTLLLAEAFWLMEGYFVRTLGMHRVYNSAFMNMLRDEDNAKYRSVIKNTLEFDPEVLKRYVNFMNNPDERTAAEQFGKGDKYFGIATLMSTMPGLPMFGHGQVEGYSEKYGMEFRRPLWDERPEEWLIARHEREIFPLLHRRALFANVDNFLLYDFYTADGTVDENVYAYSNRVGDDRALVLYHNAYGDTRGWIRLSAAYLDRTSPPDNRRLMQRTLANGLDLHAGTDVFTIFRDQSTGLEYLRNNQEMTDRGLHIELGAYRYHVFMDFRQVVDDEQHRYARLADRLDGRGVPSIDETLQELLYTPVRLPFMQVVNATNFRRLIRALEPMPKGARPITDPHETRDEVLDDIEAKTRAMLVAIYDFSQGQGNPESIAADIRRELEAVAELPHLARSYRARKGSDFRAAAAYIEDGLDSDPIIWGGLLAYVFTHALGKVAAADGFERQSRSWLDEWRLGSIITRTLRDLGATDEQATQAAAAIRVFVAQQASFERSATPQRQAAQVLEAWLKDPDVQRFMRVNRYQDKLWFNKDAFEQLLWGMLLRAALRATADPDLTRKEVVDLIGRRYAIVRRLQQAADSSEYKVNQLLAAARGEPVVADAPPSAKKARPAANADRTDDQGKAGQAEEPSP